MSTWGEMEAARIQEQRELDARPCSSCGGDRLRPTFMGAPQCHVGGDRWLTR